MARNGVGEGEIGGGIIIRPAISADIKRMWEIDQICFDPDIAYPIDFIYYHLLVLRDPAFCAFDGEAMVGFVLTAMEKRGEGSIVTIDILGPYRRRGLGGRLIGMAEQALAARGARKAVLQVAVENEAAIAFYEKHGYMRGRLLKNYYGKKKDAWRYETMPKK
ncbi:MAG: GNAT family N-acetyltransferase [Nitrospinae bacterium]|nr:GNAT family N-acetyltransferase [Nitrospinota bacterium]